jgi:RNA polymerase sigma-70 factor, ECF subfamily
MTATDDELMQSLKRRAGEDELRALYRSYGGELYGFALRRLGDRGLAEELVQDVFTRVWRHAADYDPARASFRTWLYGIARNATIDLERRRAVRPQPPPHAAAADAEGAGEDEPIERAVLRWQVQAAVERLGADHRQVIRLAHFEGLTMREIADRTGLPLGTVKSRTSYALRNLRLALEEMGAWP